MSFDTSRRLFLAGLAAVPAALSQSPLTVGQVLERIRANVGVPWRAQTVDNLIAGTPDIPVKGIVTTMMATLDVLQRAARAGRNMVITHESTFFSHQDQVDTLKDNPTYQYKLDFLNKNQMAVFHFHDHWHAHKPDGIATGMIRELGWEANADPSAERQFHFPATPLARFAKNMQTKLNIKVMRVIGDPKQPITRALASWGYQGLFPGIPYLSTPGVDALIVGETREWELVEYAQDMIASGQKKSLIILGHVVSEQAGMKYCAEWLKPLAPEVPVEFIAAPEPYWSPGA